MQEHAENTAQGNVVELSSDTFKSEVLEAQMPVLVDFWAPWCGPCKMISPLVEEIAKEMHGKLKVGKLNVDQASVWASHFGVRGIPTLILFRNGQPKEQIVGVVPREVIVSKIKPYLTEPEPETP
jgi:thioredoxin 1